jgi:predicted ferric reductase
MKIVWILYAALVLVLLSWHKIYTPILNWRNKWRIVENKAERGDARTLAVEPIGHKGFEFLPGQFAWLKTGRTPFGIGQHPISISSSSEDPPRGRISFTIKDLGDWSGQEVPSLNPGDTLWLDGPHGVFSIDRLQAMGYVLVAGGVGITPLYAICQTMADREDVRPVVLFYGGRDLDSLTFREELEALKDRMSLEVIHVLSAPGDKWTGERGYVNAEMMKRYLPKQYHRFKFLICGPKPLMDSMDEALPDLGVPRESVLTERFDMG